MMSDREKVKQGLHQHCECSLFDRCDECPYYEVANEQFLCRDMLLDNALELLKEQEEEIENLKQTAQSMMEGICLMKEQEAVEPTIDEYGNKRCGSCGHKLQSIADQDLFCCKCGKPVLWEGR